MLVLFLFAAGLGEAPAPPAIAYAGGQLRIEALDSTLGELLAKVAAVTGVTIDIPPAAAAARMAAVKLGPGPAREVLASLLSDASIDFLIQASETDPERIQAVLLIPREKDKPAARPPHSPYARVVEPPSEPPEAPVAAAEIPVEPPPANPVVEAAARRAATQPEPAPFTRPAAPSTPEALSPQAMNQQLLQMYQQRVQMIQQNRQTPPPPKP